MLGEELRLLLDLAGERIDLVAGAPLVRWWLARMVLVEAMGEAGVEVVVLVGVVAQDDAAGVRIDYHLLDAGNGAESLLDLLQQRRIALGGRGSSSESGRAPGGRSEV